MKLDEVYEQVLNGGNFWRGQEGTVYVKKASVNDPLAMGGVQNIDVSITEEIAELDDYGGATRVLDYQITSKKFTFSATLVAWDVAAYQALVGYDPTDKWDWTPLPRYQTIIVKHKTAPAYSTITDAEVLYLKMDVVLEDIPLTTDPDSWVPIEISGKMLDFDMITATTELPTWHPDKT